MDNTHIKILAMKPIINDTLSTIFAGTAVLADYDDDAGYFIRDINQQYGADGLIKHQLVPTSLLEEKQLHFNTGYPFVVHELKLVEQDVNAYVRNFLKFMNNIFKDVIFCYKLNITFDKFDEKGSNYFFNFNKPKPLSCRMIIEINCFDSVKNKYLMSNNIDRVVIFFEKVGKKMVIKDQVKLFEKMNDIKNQVLEKLENIDLEFNFDFSMSEKEFERELMLIDMIRI